MESKSVRYMMILILCQRRQWPHHLFFGVNLRSGFGGAGPGAGGQKGKKDRLIADYFVIGLSTGDQEI